jgi:ABC-type branched-subunit amino acid transport system ATPase component
VNEQKVAARSTPYQEGTDILHAEQSVRKALKFAYRVSDLEGGKLSFERDAADLLENPVVENAHLGG